MHDCTSSSLKLKVAHSDARKRPSARKAGGDSDLSYLRADSAGHPPVRAFREGPYPAVCFRLSGGMSATTSEYDELSESFADCRP